MKHQQRLKKSINRRSFLKNGLAAAGTGVVGAAMLSHVIPAFAQEDGPKERSGRLTPGDAAILRFLAAAEILETDLWQHYNELGGIQNNEVPGGSGNSVHTAALAKLEEDMDNTFTTTRKTNSHTRFSSTHISRPSTPTPSIPYAAQ